MGRISPSNFNPESGVIVVLLQASLLVRFELVVDLDALFTFLPLPALSLLSLVVVEFALDLDAIYCSCVDEDAALQS